MKRLLLFLICALVIPISVTAGGYMGIVDRSATRDTLSFQFAFLDSLGNPIAGAAGDSIYIMITTPNGTVAFRDSVLLAGVTTITIEDQPDIYALVRQVSVLDGSTTSDGLYSYSLMARDISLSLTSYYTGSFQVINSTLDALLDSAAFAAKSLQPTVAGRTLDVTTTGEAGADFDNIGGTLDAPEIGTDAFTAAKFAADAIGASEFSDAATGKLVDSTWNQILSGATHNVNNSAGKILRQIKGGSVIHDGTSDNVPANSANAISLQTGGGSPTTSTIDNFYNHQRLTIVAGTGEGQLVLISDYTGSNQVATITPAFLTTPDATSVYEILPGIVHAETLGGGYEGGAVWISSSGSTGSQLYVDGTIDNPIDDGAFATAKTVADALGLRTFHIQVGSSVTLGQTFNNYDFIGTRWSLALNGQDVGSSNFVGASVTGIGTGSTIMQFFECAIDGVTISPSHFFDCGFNPTSTDSVLFSAAGEYVFRNCYSLISGPVAPMFSLGDAVGNTTVGFRGWAGGLNLSEIGSTGEDSVSIEGFGNIILGTTNVGGELVLRGNFTLTDNSSTTTITRDAALSGTYIASKVVDSLDSRGLLDSLFAVLDTVQSQSTWVATATLLDSVLTAIADANKGNFKADISALPDTTNTNAIKDQLIDALARIDTMSMLAGWQLGTKSYTIYTNDKDSIFIISPTGDTIGIERYWHVGDTAGFPQDTLTLLRP